jgi:hypothetical protein
MTEPAQRIRLLDLDKAEALELGEFVGAEAITLEEQPPPPGSFGELTLAIAAVYVTVKAVSGLIRYFAAKHAGESFEEKIEIELPDGTRVKRRIRYRKTPDEPVLVGLARELADLTGLDPGSLLEGL